MAKYMIHACPQRMWYVEGYLIPSITSQNVHRDDITLWVDKDNLGCLESCMRAFESLPDDDNGTWHLQDDVVISERFKELTEKHDTGIVCGHSFHLHSDRRDATGYVPLEKMWFSFPCIRIPNKIARGCADYFRREIVTDEQYAHWIKARRYDDTIFSIYVAFYHSREKALNLVPNLVAHIDYLMGGTIANDATRTEPEQYFDEPETMERVKRWIDERTMDRT